MSINLSALVRQAFATAKALVPDALPEVTLRVNPTPSINPITDTSAPTWAITVANLTPVAFAAKQEKENQPVEKNLRSFAFDRAAIGHPISSLMDQTAEIDEQGVIWNVYRVESDPTGSLVILHASR